MDETDLDSKSAYRRVFDWFKGSSQLIYEREYPLDPTYSTFSIKLIDSLPDPEYATDEDRLLVAEQILTLLLEWAYHQRDKHGTPMHEYARIIHRDLKGRNIDTKNSRLYAIVSEYLKLLRRR